MCSTFSRQSPQLVHELSTITEVDTPQTSRNITDVNVGEHTSTSIMKGHLSQSADQDQLTYNKFPNFQEYCRINQNANSSAANNISISLTPSTSLILGENVDRLLQVSSEIKALNYKSYQSNASTEKSALNNSTQTALSYEQFPPHSEYAKSVSGLLDSQSIDRIQLSDASTGSDNKNHSRNSSLPDIVSELKKRNLLTHSFEIDSEEEDADTDNILRIKGIDEPALGGEQNGIKRISSESTNSWSDTLEQELKNLGILWASSMMKKSKKQNAITTSSSSLAESNDNSVKTTHRSPSKPKSPSKDAKKSLRRTPQSSSQKKDSFVDAALTLSAGNTSQPAAVNQTDSDIISRPVNLKEFLARELLKHSSMSSSSSDSSLASIYLKSFLGYSSSSPQNGLLSTPMPQHRTSTPVNNSSADVRSQNSGGRESEHSKQLQFDDHKRKGDGERSLKSGDLTEKLFSGESHLSSVRINSSSSTDEVTEFNTIKHRSEQQKHKQFEDLMAPTNLKLAVAASMSNSTSSSS